MNVPFLEMQNEELLVQLNIFSKRNISTNDVTVSLYHLHVHDAVTWPITSPRLSEQSDGYKASLAADIGCWLSSFFKGKWSRSWRQASDESTSWTIVSLALTSNHWATCKNTVSHRFYQTPTAGINSRGTTPPTIAFSEFESFTFFVWVNSIHTSPNSPLPPDWRLKNYRALSRSAECFLTVRYFEG